MNCTKCGNPISAQDMNIKQQPVDMTAPMQQPVKNANSVGTVLKKNNVITIILGVAVAILVVMLISMQGTITDLESELRSANTQMQDYETQMYNYENQIHNYENRNAVDKTIDAIGSWLE